MSFIITKTMLSKHLNDIRYEKGKEEICKFFKYLFEVELGEDMEKLAEKGCDKMVIKPSHKVSNDIMHIMEKYGYAKYLVSDTFGIKIKRCGDEIIFSW